LKKKILLILDTLRIGGGTERLTSLITKKLSEKYDINILTFFNYEEMHSFKGKYYSLGNNSTTSSRFLVFNFIQNLIKTYKLINSISPSVIVSFAIYQNLFSIFIKLLFRIKASLIISIWCNPKLAFNNRTNFLSKMMYRLKSVNKIVTIAKGVQNILENDYRIKKNKLKTIYSGIEIEKIQLMKNDELYELKDIFENTNLIKYITVSRFIEEKGHKHLIEAFSKVKNIVPNSKLIIRGDGPLRSEIEKQIKEKNLENDIIILGRKKNIFKYITKSDIFVLPSETEGLPTVLLEALACGIPIISTNCETGPKEILDNGRYGLLVNVMDSDDLAEKMLLLAKNRELINEYSKKSLEKAKFFKIEKFYNEWIKLLNQFP